MDLRNQTIFLFIYYVRNESNIYFVNFSFFKRYNTEEDQGPQYSKLILIFKITLSTILRYR